jgi:sugar lactone lactonase YvrE
VSTLAGTGEPGFADGHPRRASKAGRPAGAVGPGDTVYVADTDNHRIRKITPQGRVSTVAGTGHRSSAPDASSAVRFTRPTGVAVAANGTIYVIDSTNYVRQIAANGRVSTVADLTPFAEASGYKGLLHGVALMRDGTLYVTGPSTGHVYKVTRTGKSSILAGCAPKCDPDEKRAGDYGFNFVRGIAASAAGPVYVTDPDPNTVLRISSRGQVSVLLDASVKCRNYRLPDCLAPLRPEGVAVDASGRVYIADTGNNRILIVE